MSAYVSELDLMVHSIDHRAGVCHLTLISRDGSVLPSFTPGSHIGVRWNSQMTNFYSLTGPSTSPETYSVSVLFAPTGNGGSKWVHSLRVGDPVSATAPRSAFAPKARGRRHLLIAGGIGVTPILSHARWHASWGNDFEVFYVHPAERDTHRDDLEAICRSHLHAFSNREAMWQSLRTALRQQPIGTEIYTCGPASLIRQVREEAEALGWPASRLHAEVFSSGDTTPKKPFLARTRTVGTVNVGDNETLLEALEREGAAVPNMCRQGVCGECRIPVRRGVIDHRDAFLSPDEKAAGDSMMACVSRAEADELELSI